VKAYHFHCKGERYDWKREMVIQSYLHSKKIRLEKGNADPVVSLLEKYDWKREMPIQSYRFAQKVRLKQGECRFSRIVSRKKYD
jgi:hypothetical protein